MQTVQIRRGVAGSIPDAWIINPGQPGPAVIVVHGIERDVEAMVLSLKNCAMETGRSVVLPHFCKASWPRYQRAACKHRADHALLSLLAALRAEGRIASDPVDLAGFSGGAQFAHRFTWLYPDLVGRLCLASPGWWTFPDQHAAWPYGMAAGETCRAAEPVWLKSNLQRFLDRQIVVRVGSEDTARDRNLRAGDAIDAQQGLHRVERARKWCEAVTRVARIEGLTPRISFRVLDGCGHSFTDCAMQAGLGRDFIVKAKRCGNCGACACDQTVKIMKRNAA